MSGTWLLLGCTSSLRMHPFLPNATSVMSVRAVNSHLNKQSSSGSNLVFSGLAHIMELAQIFEECDSVNHL